MQKFLRLQIKMPTLHRLDQDGEPRIIELPGHPFALATLFVPQTSSEPGAAHPVVVGFVAAVRAAATATVRST